METSYDYGVKPGEGANKESLAKRRRNPTRGRAIVSAKDKSASVKRTSDVPVMLEGQGLQGNRHNAPTSHSMGAAVSG